MALSTITDGAVPDFSSYKRYMHPAPPQEDGSNDCLFYVMSYIEYYDADERKFKHTLPVIS